MLARSAAQELGGGAFPQAKIHAAAAMCIMCMSAAFVALSRFLWFKLACVGLSFTERWCSFNGCVLLWV